MKSQLKWSQTTPIRHQDNIISSDAKLIGQKGFVPSYEKNPTNYNMFWLLSDEYMRIWFRERDDYNKYQYSAVETAANERPFLRKYVKRKPKSSDDSKRRLPPIKLKRFQNVQSRTDDERKTKKINQ